ncbi:MAG: nuclear transport factor 2 family protein [Amphiplicatus sp.]
MTITEQHFGSWLAAYGKAWESQHAAAFISLFAEDALYYWTPFDKPKKGRGEIAAAFAAAVGSQREIEFGARILYVEAQLGAAHWSCAFTRPKTGKRVHLDGVLVVQFNDAGKALSFREWWHSDEG